MPPVGGNASPTQKTAPRKKKGTATAVKAPKRARTSGGGRRGGKSGGGGKKKSATSPGTLPNGSEDGHGAGAGGGSSVTGAGDSESDSGPYCLCRGPDNHRFMIACDRCEDWFHGDCIGMDKYTGENLVQKYICPNCSDGERYVTRYKKMCSLEGCTRPARIYDPREPSIFCSEEHCQAWWEQLIATLPRTKGTNQFDFLTQEEFMGLLDTPKRRSGEKGAAWKLGDRPFGVSDDFWQTVDLKEALTAEERSILDTSAAERYALGEEIVLCKKMLQLIDMALKRREAAIAAGKGTAKDLCGYDVRLDTVGVSHQFGAFLQSPSGEAIFKAGRLDAPPPPSSTNPGSTTAAAENTDPFTAGMCLKKKCKPHVGWSAIMIKSAKHSIKELAAQAREKLAAEARVRDSAAGRFRRKRLENNSVVVYDSDSAMEDVV
ncbi:hypothetical protein B0T25DRAFT_587332 [Lasiosphaeria hispida]|uniref:PHD-type domain-containing protein n=1 Tax=Lasiosphaeria hispida TaxID=260671 RepID=A0AAJ0HVC8_9PEZI|nr:hypothetical protein B0T25DRAFT_587332 [Lasiosphaeria hispida]